MSDFKGIIEDAFSTYAGAVLQSRALIDVRDGLKPSARQILYCMNKYKYTPDKPYQKTMAAIGEALKHFYIHGDSSCEGIIMRAGQPFAMRYPLVSVEGNCGNLMSSGNWAASRYTSARLAPITNFLFANIDKETIAEWRDNYSETEQYPSVLPSKGFYNIVNGTTGIGIGMACSVPQYNLRELNNALIHLIDNPDCSFNEIYCAPDFATGAILINEEEVKNSMRQGQGFACKLRSVVEFDQKERCFVVTEIPYSVYTNTICSELEAIIEDENNPGVERFNDLTNTSALIKIYLTKKANPDKVLKHLYKNTSLESYYSINFTMLDQGRYPRVFTWKEMLQAHIDHEKNVYRRGFEFDLRKIERRIHIIDGLLICLASIDEVVATIKASATTAAASLALQEKFVLDAEQAKAVLDMKLSRLAHLEVQKLQDERESLEKEADHIRSILNDEILFNNEIKKGLQAVADKFGDARRTRVVDMEVKDDEVIEQKQLSLSFTNKGAVFVTETSSLYAQRRNGVGAKFKLEPEEFVVDNLIGQNTDTILFFTNRGMCFHMRLGEFNINEKQYLSNMNIPGNITAAVIVNPRNSEKFIVFITQRGIIKKSQLAEYNLKRSTGAQAIKLDPGDEIISSLIVTDERIGIMSRKGQFIMIDSTKVRPLGRLTRGVIGMKLNEDDNVHSARALPADTKAIFSISQEGLGKRTNISEFSVTNTNTKGVSIQKADDMADFLALNNDNDILINSTTHQLRVQLADIPILSRGAKGVKFMKLNNNDIVGVSAL